jgi:hypothetical protein
MSGSTYNPLVSNIAGYGDPEMVDYDPVSAASAGSVFVLDGIAYFVNQDIAAGAQGSAAFSGGIWAGNKAAGAWSNGAPVYWDSAATPNVATSSGTGAFTQTPTSTATFVGYAVPSRPTLAAAATGDQFGYFVKAISVAAGTAVGAQSAAASGSIQSQGAALIVGSNFVTGANGTAGVLLPPGAAAGAKVDVKNSDAANAVLKVYPNTGAGTINAIAAGGAISMAAKTACTFVCQGSDVWYTIPLLPS